MQGRQPETIIILKDKEKKILKSYLRKTKIEYRSVLRSKIILLASENKYRNQEIANKLECTRQIVYKWKKRFRHLRMKGLEDNPRSGRPIIFTAKQRTKIMALATKKPEDKGLHFTDWSTRELANYAIENGIVSSIHWTTIGDWLKGADIKPHRWEYWLNSTDPNFEKKNAGSN